MVLQGRQQIATDLGGKKLSRTFEYAEGEFEELMKR